MKIGDRVIERDGPVYVIAELGVNHDGDARRAIELVDAAADAGADAIKMQLFRAELLMSAAARPAQYQLDAGECDPVAMLKRLELSPAVLGRVCERAHELGMHAIMTVFSVELVEAAQGFPIDAYKTASPDIVHRPLIEALVGTQRPLIMSTGAATMEEVERAAGWIDSALARLAMLQCVSVYPTPMEHAELTGISALRSAFANLPIGYSDHTTDVETGARAVAHGAVILEKHVTYDRTAAGPDHAASLDAEGFSEYVRLARAAAAQPADCGVKRVLDIERDVRAVSRQSIVTQRAIGKGERVLPEDITFKRPGLGFEPWQLDEVIERTAARDIANDAPVMREDLA